MLKAVEADLATSVGGYIERQIQWREDLIKRYQAEVAELKLQQKVDSGAG